MKKIQIVPIVLAIAFLSCSLPIGPQPTSASTTSASLTRAVEPISAVDMVKRLSMGINLGNTLDAPSEGEWAKVAQEYYFDDYVKAGFSSVRIPVTWDNHLSTTAPYTVDEMFFRRVEQIVDWALSRNLAVVLDCHHEDWIRLTYPSSAVPRLESLWKQIALRFADRSPLLVFEIMNEPHGDIAKADVDDMNDRILKIIRSSNPTRNVVIGARSYNSVGAMITELEIPNDPHIIATYHSYDPWPFCGEATGSWGTPEQIAVMEADFADAKAWATQKNVPVLIGEYGVVFFADLVSRVKWYQNFTRLARANGFAFMAWDDSGDFGIYRRDQRTWDQSILDSIKGLYPSVSPLPSVSPVYVPEGPYQAVFDLTGGKTIPASDYNVGMEGEAYHDTDAVNRGGAYRTNGVDVQASLEGGYHLAWTKAGEWLDYEISSATTATYKLVLRSSTILAARKIHLEIDGVNVTGPIVVDASGNWQKFVDQAIGNVTVKAGRSTLRFAFDDGDVNFKSLTFVPLVAPSLSPIPSPTPSPSASPTPTTYPTPSPTVVPALSATLSKTATWNSGYTAKIVVANAGSAVSTWQLTFSLPSGATLGDFWEANLTVSGSTVTAKPLNYNAAIASGGSISFGFNLYNSTQNVSNFRFGPAASPTPTVVPTPTPTVVPTPTPTVVPTPSPSVVPTPSPTALPTPSPIAPLSPISLKSWQATSNSGGLTIWEGGVGNWDSGEWIRFASVNLSTGYKSISLSYATTLSGSYDVRLDSPTGANVASLNFSSTGGWGTYATTTIAFDATKTGVHDVYIRCNSGALNLGESKLNP